jgi:hypothetical protein
VHAVPWISQEVWNFAALTDAVFGTLSELSHPAENIGDYFEEIICGPVTNCSYRFNSSNDASATSANGTAKNAFGKSAAVTKSQTTAAN